MAVDMVLQDYVNKAVVRRADPQKMLEIIPDILLAIESAETPEEISGIRSMTRVFQSYLKETLPGVMKNRQEVMAHLHKTSVLWLEGCAKAGKLWQELENKRENGWNQYSESGCNDDYKLSWQDVGFKSRDEVKRCVRAAELDEAERWQYYDECRVSCEEATLNGIQEVWKRKKRQDEIDDLISEAEGREIDEKITVLQGDMLEVLSQLPAAFDLIIADPPYNVTPWAWDNRGDRRTFIAETRQWLKACLSVANPKYNLFWFCSPQYATDIEMIMRRLKLPIQSRIIWHRRNMAKGGDAKSKFIDSWEMIFHIGNRPLNFSKEWDSTRFDVQTFAVPQTNFTDHKFHPTQKPLDLIQWLVKHASFRGDYILDPFAGSGTTGHAALLEGDRHCTLIEKEYEYVDIIRARLAVL